MIEWEKRHILKVGDAYQALDDLPAAQDERRSWEESNRHKIEPWLSALLQSEHLSLLLGSGLPTALAAVAGTKPATMVTDDFDIEKPDNANLKKYAEDFAKRLGRGKPNLEDQLSAAALAAQGLRVLGEEKRAKKWEEAIDKVLLKFAEGILSAEQAFHEAVKTYKANPLDAPQHILVSFLMSFASRVATRERLNIFTTNYDRLIEFGCDLAGLRLLDRFVGQITPKFRSSRLQVDLHYNPPGIRGEPRHLEGVAYLTKLHGSIDWREDQGGIIRVPLSFGADKSHPSIPKDPFHSLMIFPNSAKDFETAGYPYAELFRDFSAAVCRPNSVLITYGYGFGDDHINRVISDMLTLPSTHLVIISYGEGGAGPNLRIESFLQKAMRSGQISLLLGPHFGDLKTLVTSYLPRPAIDLITMRAKELVERRDRKPEGDQRGEAKGQADKIVAPEQDGLDF